LSRSLPSTVPISETTTIPTIQISWPMPPPSSAASIEAAAAFIAVIQITELTPVTS